MEYVIHVPRSISFHTKS